MNWTTSLVEQRRLQISLVQEYIKMTRVKESSTPEPEVRLALNRKVWVLIWLISNDHP